MKTTIYVMRFIKGAGVLTASAALAACGGGSGGGGGGPAVVSTDTTPVLAAGSLDFSASSAVFPYYFLDADLDRDVVRGISSIEIIDPEIIELVDSETGSTFWLVLDTGTIDNGIFTFVFDAGDDGIPGTGDDGVSATSQFEIISRGNGYYSLNLRNDEFDDNGFPIRERVGGFGFETAEGDMPTTADPVTYSGSSTMYVVSDSAGPDDASYIVFTGGFGMEVNFDNGTFSGDMSGSNHGFNLDDIGDDNDSLNLEFGIEGTITGNKLDGTVSGLDATGSLNGDTDITAVPTLTTSDLDGQFFGTDAADVNGTWGAEFGISDGDASFGGEIGGFFEADNSL